MSKTPEQLAKEWAIDWHKDCDYPDAILKHTHAATMTTFLAGYKAAQEHAHAALEEAEARIQELRDQLMEESGGRLRLFKDDADAKAAYLEALQDTDSCEHILDMEKMVDVKSCSCSGILNNWISVKDRLPEGGEFVSCFGRAAYENGLSVTQGCYNKWGQWHSCEWDGCGGYEYLVEVTHWMPLPDMPKEEK